ncbi:MAG: phenylacetate--CoA ligase [Bacteroidota bacterium]|nr:phenylacetate--CoA ligase [Bacteroidota bacterium]
MENLDRRPISEIEQYQESELQKLLLYLSDHSPFYRELFLKNNIDPAKITLAGLSSIPPTSKDNLQAHNMDFLCVEKNKIAEYCSTSGTLGAPVTIALTSNDLERLAYNEYCSFLQAGCTSEDIFQLMLTMDKQFMAGIAYYAGIQKLGASAIRIGSGNMPLQIDSILNNKPTVLIAVPSFILKLIEYAKENNIDLNKTSIKKIICIGEAIRNADFSPNELALRIQNNWNVKMYSTYASTEKQTAFTECESGNGAHAHADLLIFEILDENNQPLPAGEYGELTVTTLGVEGMPLLRYKTGDICTYYNSPCTCGRHSLRISPIIGRKQQLIKFKGTTLYPSTIYNTLSGIEEIKNYFVEVSLNEINTDDLHLYISVKDEKADTQQKITEMIRSSLRVLPKISFISNDNILSLQQNVSNRKLNKFYDKRKTEKL